jgi:hypothetical protein
MRPPARPVVLFENEYLLPRLCQCNGSGQSACARANDDRVVVCHVFSLKIKEFRSLEDF